MPMEIVYVVLAMVLGWWGSRLARSRGSRAPLLWGGLVFVLSVLPRPWNLLGIAPLFLLLFVRPGIYRPPAPPRELACPRCNASHSASQRYCISCGWELELAYPDLTAPEATQRVEQPAEPEPTATVEPPGPRATAEPTEPHSTAEESAPAAEPKPTPEPAPAEPTALAEPVLASQEVQAPTAAQAEPAEAQVAEPEEEAAEAPVFRGLPTAPNMTERGIRLFNQGRVQEAIDQFTKAIALDANYKEAWERRAEAYSKLGRSEQAAEDRRRLQAINAGSTSS